MFADFVFRDELIVSMGSHCARDRDTVMHKPREVMLAVVRLQPQFIFNEVKLSEIHVFER